MTDAMIGEVVIDYTNWKGRRSPRRVWPREIVYKSSAHHPEPQWLLVAHDLDDGETLKSFAMKDIHSWRPA